MSGDPNELTEQEAQIHEEWRGEEMDSTAEPRTLAIDPVIDTYIGDWLDQENERAAEEMPGRPHEQQAATDVLPVSLTHTADQPRTLRQILFTHRALAAATALEITELMAELQPFLDGPDAGMVTDPKEQAWHALLDRLVDASFDLDAAAADARRQRDDARGRDQLFRSSHGMEPARDRGTHEGLWVKNNPGLVALLQAVDGA